MQNVTIDRHKYIGGSDIPIIMGLSPFKSRFELLQEKAQIREDDFTGNEYTEYGNIMEPVIRDYINVIHKHKFKEDKVINDDIRYHADGYDKDDRVVLEIKTTSQVYDEVSGYKKYIVQLLFGMMTYDCYDGILAVYDRPEDFDTNFDVDRLQIFHIKREDYKNLEKSIETAVDSFREDLKKMKENPFITEEELQPNDIVRLTDKIVYFENQLVAMKEIEKQVKEAKATLKKAMEDHGIKKWTTDSGIQVTLVADGMDKTVKEVDVKKLTEENPELAEKYTVEKLKKGRAGYVKITLPK